MYKSIWLIAWPMLISNLSVPLTGMIDAAILGRLGTPVHLASVALGASFITLIFSAFNFLRLSTIGFSAQQKGNNSPDTMLQQNVYLALFAAGTLVLLSPWVSKACLFISQPSGEIRVFTAEYLNIRLMGAPAVFANFIMVGWAIGQQQTRIAMLNLLLTNLANILLDIVFILGLSLASKGAAMASVSAEYLAALTTAAYLYKQQPAARQMLAIKGLNLIKGFSRVLGINSDLFIRSVCLLSVFAFFNIQSERFGAEVLAANAILIQIVFFHSFFLDAFAHAAEALGGEAKGMRDQKRFSMVLKQTFLLSLITAILLMVSSWMISEWIPRWFTNIASVQQEIRASLMMVLCLPILSFVGYWLDGIAVGLGASRLMRNSMLASTFLFFLPVWFFTRHMETTGLWLAFISFTLARAALLAPVLRVNVASLDQE